MTVTPSRNERSESLLYGRSGRILRVIALGSMANTGGRFLLSPLLPAVIRDFQITSADAGLAMTTMWVLTAVCRYPGGRLSDRWSRKTILVLAQLVFGFGAILVFVAPVFPVFVLGTAFIGIGAGLYRPAALAQLSDVFVARRGQAIGINTSMLNLASALVSGLAVVVLATATWRVGFVPIVLLVGSVVLAFHRWIDGPYVASKPKLEIRSTLVRLAGPSRIRLSLLGYVLFMIAWQGASTFLPTLLHADKGLSESMASLAFGSIFLVGVVCTPVAGRIGDRVGHSLVASGTIVLAILGLSVVLLADGLWLLWAGILVFAVGMTSFWPVMNTFVMNVFGDGTMGGDWGALSAIYIAIGSVGSLYVGVVATQFDYVTAFAGLLVSLVGSLVVVAALAASQR